MPRRRQREPEDLVAGLVEGDRRAAARLITRIENGSAETNAWMKRLYPHTGKAMVIGVTGAGGSGKSSMIDHLIGRFRAQGKRVGVVAVDPSSPFSGGALLGDRIRLQRHSMDEGVYIRSMGSRGYLGGLARATTDVVRIMEAMGNHVVIIETLGVGQDEIDIIHLAQTCLLLLTPGMGDDIQAMKAGVIEIAHVIALNKADLEGAESCLRGIEAALRSGGRGTEGTWMPKVIPTVAVGTRSSDILGIDELMGAVMEHQTFLKQSRAMERVQAARIEQELGLIFREEVERLVFAGLKGTGRKREYIAAIMSGKTDPYSVVEEVLRESVLNGQGQTRAARLGKEYL